MPRHPERDGDFLVREIAGNQVEDLDLSSTEPSRRSVVLEMVSGADEH